MNKALKKRGEGYVDVCVGVIAFVMLLVIAINIFSFIDLRLNMDQIADELLETATFTGSYDREFRDRVDELKEQYGLDFTVSCGADEFFNSTFQRVQLGHTMTVTVSVKTKIQGLGAFSIPVTISVTRSGLSQRYWK